MKFSKSARLAGGSGFFLDEDVNAPADSITVSKSDVSTATNLPAGSTYDFDASGNLIVTNAPVLTAAQIKSKTVAARWEAIKAKRDSLTEDGGYKVETKWYHSDQKSRSQQQDNEAEGVNLVPVQWKTMDGSFVTMTAELAEQIRVARMVSDRAIFAVAEAHRIAMEESADPAAYDFSTGWPATFIG